mmetsp:Transcript_7636/g.18714  ORF Transcript_7636/g.18714 Transcript_7636/m.18714 type:complete len:646 (+) Transcript_7636:192-2129(+)|eukprot:CAMPEP_0116093714 /NCGR_PEP_ID=MMETSP0327-20121206/8745_1 /TAXON_ID=44447 /ORGANISM="Pseudo-nitzschia delicatissima, Strain B596" /LENGTH=645 /DNA_ID=CAMNT_0003585269 /DNA_START=98 /DNA_END=2035 /DNA_ORIENTATION=-
MESSSSSSMEKKAVVFFNDDYKDIMKKNQIIRKERSLSLSDTSLDNYSASTTLLTGSVVETECSESIEPSFEFGKSLSKDEDSSTFELSTSLSPLAVLRLKYLSVNLVVMLADGLQGTHLYVLYEGYGFNVASLYALGFITGAITTPITGPLIDRFGRKRSAMLYCALEMWINLLEQYPFLSGLLISRMVGGITTNLLSSVFETWLDTEFRNRRREPSCCTDTSSDSDEDTTTTFETSIADEEKDAAKNEYELIMRDSVIVSNLASIASGYLAHLLAEQYGSVGPFQGAVSCTGIALVVISLLWTENYGVSSTPTYSEEDEMSSEDSNGPRECDTKSVMDYIKEAIAIFRSDPKILRLGIIQGLSVGSLQIFIFLWSPTLQSFTSANHEVGTMSGGSVWLQPYFDWAIDGTGNPAYGLIFGSFMFAGVCGGLCAPYVRRAVSFLFSGREETPGQTIILETEGISVRPMELEFLVGANYILCAVMLLVPFFLSASSPGSFSIALAAFLIYEFLVGVTMPCEGVLRSLYLPSDGRATMTMVPRMVVNLAVSLGVLLTRYVPEQFAFIAIAILMTCSGFMQLSFMSRQEWTMIRRASIQHARRLSSTLATKTKCSPEQNGNIASLCNTGKSCNICGNGLTLSNKSKDD